MATISVEKRKRGFFGWVFLTIFLVFQALMVTWFVAGMNESTKVYKSTTNEHQQAGAAIGTMIGAGMVMTFWALGTVVFGVPVALSRGKKITTTKEV